MAMPFTTNDKRQGRMMEHEREKENLKLLKKQEGVRLRALKEGAPFTVTK